MGWLHTKGASKQDIINDRIRFERSEKYTFETLAHSVRGNVLWRVQKKTDLVAGESEMIICCDLLSRNDGDWGYKDMYECEHPYYYDCPLKFLDMVPVANQEWRDKVRKAAALKRRKLEIGKRYALIGCSIPGIQVIQLNPLVGIDVDGKVWRFKRSSVGEEITSKYG